MREESRRGESQQMSNTENMWTSKVATFLTHSSSLISNTFVLLKNTFSKLMEGFLVLIHSVIIIQCGVIIDHPGSHHAGDRLACACSESMSIRPTVRRFYFGGRRRRAYHRIQKRGRRADLRVALLSPGTENFLTGPSLEVTMPNARTLTSHANVG
jgi:hypothetical protein